MSLHHGAPVPYKWCICVRLFDEFQVFFSFQRASIVGGEEEDLARVAVRLHPLGHVRAMGLPAGYKPAVVRRDEGEVVPWGSGPW